MSTERWSRLKAADIMKKDILTVPPSAGAREIALAMSRKGVSGLAVRERGGPIVGIVSWRDVFDRLADPAACHDTKSVHDYFRVTDEAGTLFCEDDSVDDAVRAADVMNTELLTIDAEAGLQAIAAMMSEYRVHRLLVRDDSGTIVGILSTLDVMDALSS